MLALILVLVIVPAIGGFYFVRGKARSLKRLEATVAGDIQNRLAAAGRLVEGTVSVDGRSLETKRGVVTLAASKAPESFVIDLTKFAGKTALRGALTIVRKEDAATVTASKSLQILYSKDPTVAARYHVLVSDVEEGQRWATSKLTDALEGVEAAVRTKIRLQVAHATATVIVFRGLSKADELKAFHDAAVRVLEELEASV